MIRPLILAIQFLTRLPGPRLNHITEREIGLSQFYYPLAGLLIGFILIGCAHFITLQSSALEAALILTIWVLITGALHIDGLADCADAWVGGYGDREKTLAIMKDPQSGPVAVTLVICVLLIKYAALEIIISHQAWPGLILAPVVSRSLLPLLFHTSAYVSPGGLGSALKEQQSVIFNALTQLATLGLVVYLLGLASIILLLVIFILFIVIRQISLKRLAGITGDVAGALVELSEVVVLVTFLSLINQ
ncbi:MAG: adenosylcobinamide-GDP ribazoletransferase [Gammaproteobacteria bacterium]|nr:adenosylcobinamide-GDP ribazoletransferase [Gammaproteobacteria bacterium]